MALLAGKLYDPATAVSIAATTAVAMTAFDTTNLRHTFTVPASGNVLVRIMCNWSSTGTGGTSGVLFGVLQGSTVLRRVSGQRAGQGAVANVHQPQEAVFTVSGLTPGASLTWDAAYAIEANIAGVLAYGGPNDTTADNAWGGIVFEIWEA